MIEGFDKAKCNRRNRLMAARGSVESIPMRFLRTVEAPAAVFVSQSGGLPDDDAAALELINARLPQGADPLTLDQIYIHYCEAANGNLIADRHAFFATSTLVNIATGASLGVAFMNSHRTGDLSSPAELPFGKTFTGRYEAYLDEDGQLQERSIVGFYMLRGIQPNGGNGPATDALHTMIDGGQLADVSVGLAWGPDGCALCDVCGQDYMRGNDCPHIAGTTRNMSPEQIEAQRARVASGKASYTLYDCELSEVSGVYDGAVPGAGFSKGLRLIGQFSDDERQQFREAFLSLLDDETISGAGRGKTAASNGNPSQQETTHMAENERLSPGQRLLAFLRGEGFDMDAAGGERASVPATTPPAENPSVQPAVPAQPATTSAADIIAAQIAQNATAASFLVQATCSHFEPADREGLITLATAALLLDGGEEGEACKAFRSLAEASQSDVTMLAPMSVLIAGRQAGGDIKAATESVVKNATRAMNGGGRK